jgi:polysaccharide biosynthesis/export protein
MTPATLRGRRWPRFLPLTLLLLSACATSGGTAPLSESPVVPLAVWDYVPRQGDVLRVQVWPESALGGEFPIERTGEVYLPALGPVQAEGRSVGELVVDLRARYGEDLRMPVVTVLPIFPVTVLGPGIGSPGVYQMDPRQGMVGLLVQAGGLRPGADEQNIKLYRGTQIFTYNFQDVLARGGASLNTPLQSGDLIVVERKGGITWSGFLQTTSFIFTMASLLRLFNIL